jgi:hypothetical protein
LGAGWQQQPRYHPPFPRHRPQRGRCRTRAGLAPAPPMHPLLNPVAVEQGEVAVGVQAAALVTGEPPWEREPRPRQALWLCVGMAGSASVAAAREEEVAAVAVAVEEEWGPLRLRFVTRWSCRSGGLLQRTWMTWCTHW